MPIVIVYSFIIILYLFIYLFKANILIKHIYIRDGVQLILTWIKGDLIPVTWPPSGSSRNIMYEQAYMVCKVFNNWIIQ